jgi:hypothetical protein
VAPLLHRTVLGGDARFRDGAHRGNAWLTPLGFTEEIRRAFGGVIDVDSCIRAYESDSGTAVLDRGGRGARSGGGDGIPQSPEPLAGAVDGEGDRRAIRARVQLDMRATCSITHSDDRCLPR